MQASYKVSLRTISVSRTVNVAVVPLLTLILDMRRVDSDTTGLLFGRLVDLLVVCEFGTTALGKNLGDSCCQSSLSMVDVTWRRVSPREDGNKLVRAPMVPMFRWGLVRENLEDAASAYPRRPTAK